MTQDDVKKNALMSLNAIMAGETPTTWHDAQMTAAFNEVHAMLDGVGIASFLVTDPVPDEIAGDVTALVAAQRIDIFPPPTEIYNRIMVKAAAAEQNIRRYVTIDPDNELPDSPEIEYF